MFSTLSISSPLGDLIAIVNETHLVMLEFADSKGLERKVSVIASGCEAIQGEKKDSTYGLDRFMLRDDGDNTLLQETKLQLSEYFSGARKNFTIPLAPTGTTFQMKAWKALEQIPHGETRSYLEETTMIGNPKAVRAIGGANNKNPIVIIIPCHRVIGADGKLVGYGGGMERKIWLLEHEKKTQI